MAPALGKRGFAASVAFMTSAPQDSATATSDNSSDGVSNGEKPADPTLASFRKSIDNIDAALIHMLAERFRITQAVGEYKAKATLPPADPKREAKQIERLRGLAISADLDPEFSEKFIRFVIDEVIRHHRQAAGQ